MLSGALNAFFLVYAALFPIVNPVGGAPIFLSLTRYASDSDRHALAARVAFNGFFLLLGSVLVGSYVLEFFGITLPAVRIAGGLVVTSFGWKLLQAGDDGDANDDRAKPAAARPTDAFYPLTMPLTVGPGSMAVAITLGSQRPAAGLADSALLAGGAVLGLAAIALTIFLSYRFADRIVAAFGKSGTNVLMRLSAFILVCIGIQILWNGYLDLTALR